MVAVGATAGDRVFSEVKRLCYAGLDEATLLRAARAFELQLLAQHALYARERPLQCAFAGDEPP